MRIHGAAHGHGAMARSECQTAKYQLKYHMFFFFCFVDCILCMAMWIYGNGERVKESETEMRSHIEAPFIFTLSHSFRIRNFCETNLCWAKKKEEKKLDIAEKATERAISITPNSGTAHRIRLRTRNRRSSSAE